MGGFPPKVESFASIIPMTLFQRFGQNAVWPKGARSIWEGHLGLPSLSSEGRSGVNSLFDDSVCKKPGDNEKKVGETLL